LGCFVKGLIHLTERSLARALKAKILVPELAVCGIIDPVTLAAATADTDQQNDENKKHRCPVHGKGLQ
jgi:hypothetical protein